MPFEYKMLALMTFFFLLAWMPSSIAKLESFGAKWLLSNRNPIKEKELVPWGARAERAHNNLKDNFPGFVVAIFLLGLTNHFDHGTSWLSALYVGARLCHFIFYVSGKVQARAWSYIAGLCINFVLLIKIFL